MSAIYAARAELQPLMYEGFLAGGVAAGGQLTTTTEVENFPGFPEGVMGLDLMDKMRQQALNCGTEIRTETVVSVDFSKRPFKVYVDEVTHLVNLVSARVFIRIIFLLSVLIFIFNIFKEKQECESAETVIIATGATAKRLGLPGEDKYWGKGISACAVCDGALPIFRNQPLLVIGGGDSACEEASFLSKYGSSVTMFVRGDTMRASKTMARRVLDNDKINVMYNVRPIEAKSKQGQVLESVKFVNNLTKEEDELGVRGLFYAVGHQPNTGFLNGQLELDSTGYILTKPGTTETSVPGVFACGDVQDKKWRQAITAAGSGCMAALSVEHYLQANQNKI